MNIVSRRNQRGAGIFGTIFKIGLPIVTSMLGGSGRQKFRRRRRMTTYSRIRKRRNQKGKGIISNIGKLLKKIVI